MGTLCKRKQGALSLDQWGAQDYFDFLPNGFTGLRRGQCAQPTVTQSREWDPISGVIGVSALELHLPLVEVSKVRLICLRSVFAERCSGAKNRCPKSAYINPVCLPLTPASGYLF